MVKEEAGIAGFRRSAVGSIVATAKDSAGLFLRGELWTGNSMSTSQLWNEVEELRSRIRAMKAPEGIVIELWVTATVPYACHECGAETMDVHTPTGMHVECPVCHWVPVRVVEREA